MKDHNIHEIIGKYLANEITDDEVLIFNEWLNLCDENLKEFELHKKAWEETRIRYDNRGADRVFREVLNRIDDDSDAEITPIPIQADRHIRVNFSFISKIAASLLVLVTLGYLMHTHRQESSIDKSTVAMVEKINPAGQKSTIYLPDGSEVILNAESKISHPEKFSNNAREVVLTGEAFFNVIKNPDKPFIVRSGQISTTVLGTSFNVKAFEGESTVYVALKSGKVKVDIMNERGSQELYLEPGEGISYDRSSHLAVKEEFDEDLLLGWKDGKIVFKGADFDDIINTLSRWYGVTFSVENKDKEQWSFTGGPYEKENLNNVLNTIGFAKGFTHEIDENNRKHVLLKFN